MFWKVRMGLSILVLTALFLTARAFLSPSALVARAYRPSVVVITVSGLNFDPEARPDHPATPTLNLLRGHGAWFANAYATGTNRVSNLASIVSGRPVGRHGVQPFGGYLAPEENELASLFRRLRYRSGAFAAAGRADRLGADGFDRFRGDLDDDSDIHRAFLAWLDEAAGSAPPFGAWLAYGGQDGGGEAPPDSRALRKFDYALGKLRCGLQRRGYNELNTIFIVAGEFGGAAGTAGDGIHPLRPEVVRVPLVWVGPKREPGATARHPVQTTGIVPALWETFNLAAPPESDGSSLFAAGPAAELIIERRDNQNAAAEYGLISGDWLYVRSAAGDLRQFPLQANPAPPDEPAAAMARLARLAPGSAVPRPDTPDQTRDFQALGYLQ